MAADGGQEVACSPCLALHYDGGAWIERQTNLAAQPTWRTIHFLDLNGDGLSDAVYTGVGTICGPDSPACDPPDPYTIEGWPYDVPFQSVNDGKIVRHTDGDASRSRSSRRSTA